MRLLSLIFRAVSVGIVPAAFLLPAAAAAVGSDGTAQKAGALIQQNRLMTVAASKPLFVVPRDIHTRLGTPLAFDLGFQETNNGLAISPDRTPALQNRSLICGIEEGGKLSLLPACEEKFEIVPESVLNSPEGEPGLRSEYYCSTSLRGRLGAVRIDRTVDFNWSNSPPASGMTASNYSVRWSGTIEPSRTGACKFAVTADNGVRLWVDNKLLIDTWQSHPHGRVVATFTFKKKTRHGIRLDYLHTQGTARASLSWNWGTYTASATRIAEQETTLQRSTYTTEAGFSVNVCSPFAQGDALDANSFATRCQLAPVFLVTISVTNNGDQPRQGVMLFGLDRPMQEIASEKWTGIAYADTPATTSAPGSREAKTKGQAWNHPLAITTDPGRFVVRALEWGGSPRVHGVIAIPYEIQPNQSVSRVFMVSGFSAESNGAPSPYYKTIWPSHQALLDWAWSNRDTILRTTVDFDNSLNLEPGPNAQRSAMVEACRAHLGSLILTADPAGAAHLTTPTAVPPLEPNDLSKRITPAWVRSLRVNPEH